MLKLGKKNSCARSTVLLIPTSSGHNGGVVCRDVICNWLTEQRSMARFALHVLVVLSVNTAMSRMQFPSDTSHLNQMQATWCSIAGGVGFLKGPGVTLGTELSHQHRDLVLGARYTFYRVTGVYQILTDVGLTPSPSDYNSEFAILIGGNIIKSKAGHTSLSIGPCYSSGTYQEFVRYNFVQVPFSRIGVTLDVSHQFRDPSVSGVSGPGIRLVYSHNSKVSLIAVQFMLLIGLQSY